MWNEPVFDVLPLREAVAREYPNTKQRILALLSLYGSGAGPWTGFPSYETAAETLLLDFKTPELVAAAQSGELTGRQLEGAARLFCGWAYSRYGPRDVDEVPPGLQKELLNYTLKSNDDDKIGRAEEAFGKPPGR